ncbi:MAG: alpha/beta hydrolase domain-containing protein [Planctomycetota bacterium]
MRIPLRLVFCVSWLLFVSGTSTASAEVVRWEIISRTPYANGQKFGDVGSYELITGKIHYALDPAAKFNEDIVDLTRAPKNAAGKVEFWSDLQILTPTDPTRANRALLYDVNNRGNKTALGFFNNSGGSNSDDGFLMRHGFTLVWNGWDGELLPGDNRLRLSPPIATDGDKKITGPVRCEIVPTKTTQRTVINWDKHGSYRPTAQGLKNATLTVRERAADQREPIPREQFKIDVREIPSDSPSQLPLVELEFPAGLKQGFIYELIYEAQDPLVHGVCFASVRDLISALKHGGGEDHPFAKNSGPQFKRALGFGVSQSGRFLREFLQAGFNADEQGRIVFEGLLPHVAGAGLGSFNHRFAQPTRHVNQHDHHDYPGDRFPFAYDTQTDPLSGRTDGILARATATQTVPLLMHTQSAGEYYTRSGSLVHTDPLGEKDAEIPDTVRIYAFGGTQHGPAKWPPAKGTGKYFDNPGNYKPLLRALILALDRWVTEKQTPPPSVYPQLAKGTLIKLSEAQHAFVSIPGVEFPQVMQQPPLFDLGPRWYSDRIIDLQPPRAKGLYQALVPQPGTDGNETASTLLPPDVAVPLGTHTGWNLRRVDVGAENELVSLGGAYIPFATTKKQREATGDPRPSLEERYGSLRAYIDQLEKRCHDLEKQGFVLSEDIPTIIQTQTQRARPMFEDLGN